MSLRWMTHQIEDGHPLDARTVCFLDWTSPSEGATMTQDKALPDWARKIYDLRKRLGLNQTTFGSRLHYSAMAVSRWESGKQEPTAQCYIQMGNLAGDPHCWDFWARAGLQRSDLAQMFPSPQSGSQAKKWLDFDIVHAGGAVPRAGRKKARRPKLVAIPLLDIHVGTLG